MNIPLRNIIFYLEKELEKKHTERFLFHIRQAIEHLRLAADMTD